jgi:hypothetical protein
VPLQADTAAKIPLNDGWTIVSNPFDQSVPWTAVEAANGGDLQALWPFNGAFNDTTMTFGSAVSGQAYYFFNDDGNRDSLVVPYPAAPSGAAVSKDAASSPLLALSAGPARGDAPASTVRLGQAPTAAAEDALVAPTGRFEPVSLRIKRPTSEADGAARTRFLMRSRRVAENGGVTFPLRLTHRVDGPIVLRAENVSALTRQSTGLDGSSVALIRPAAGTTHDLHAENRVTIDPTRSTTTLRVAIGTEAYVQDQQRAVLPDEVTLQAYPNPVRTQGTVAYALPEETDVTLRVYDVLGRQVATLASGTQPAGRHTVTLDTDQLSSGVYFGRLEAGGQTLTRKITVVR